MPKVACPACKTDVKYPRDAEPGTEVTCPECEEAFVPPELRANRANPRERAYNPNEEEGYAADAPIADPDRARKKKHAAAARHHAREQRRREARGGGSDPRPFFGGPEIVLLIVAAAFAVALPIGFAVAKRFPSIGEAALVIVAYVGIFIAFGVKMIRARTRQGG